MGWVELIKSISIIGTIYDRKKKTPAAEENRNLSSIHGDVDVFVAERRANNHGDTAVDMKVTRFLWNMPL